MKDGEDGSQSSGPVLEHKKKIDDIKISFLGEISHGPNDPVPEQVRPLLDYIQEVRSSWPDDVETMLFHDVLDLAPSYINSSPTEKERYLRLIGICRLMMFIISEDIDLEGTTQIRVRYEELKKEMEEVDGPTPLPSSRTGRLNDVFDGLMELAVALGLADSDDVYI